MKKLLLVLLIGLFALTLVAGCGQKEEPKPETPAVEEPAVEAVPDSGTVADSAIVEEDVTEEAGN